jgi:hypothetical protein
VGEVATLTEALQVQLLDHVDVAGIDRRISTLSRLRRTRPGRSPDVENVMEKSAEVIVVGSHEP